MKLYTKRGDDGGTDLFGGKRVGKDSLRVETYGTVDELNSTVGLAAAACQAEELGAILRVLQERLFELGADLAMPPATGNNLAIPPGPSDASALKPAGKGIRIGTEQIAEAEGMIDRTCEPLPPMKHFVLPGGSELAARLHLARTVCRRAERLCVGLNHIEPGLGEAIIYLNRLSDLFFAMARRANQLAGVEDVPWQGKW